jgi:hypothetical protein
VLLWKQQKKFVGTLYKGLVIKHLHYFFKAFLMIQKSALCLTLFIILMFSKRLMLRCMLCPFIILMFSKSLMLRWITLFIYYSHVFEKINVEVYALSIYYSHVFEKLNVEVDSLCKEGL